VLAQMKASSLSLYWLHRDFDVAAVANATTGEMQPAPGVGGVSARNVSAVLQDFMANARSFLQLPAPSPGEDHPDGVVHYNRCMVDASTLSYLNEKLAFRAKCVACRCASFFAPFPLWHACMLTWRMRVAQLRERRHGTCE
jgi:hypothetical protein